MRTRLLITGAGTGTAYSYALAVAQRHPDVQLVTGDINPAELTSAALFAKTHVQLPPVADEEFLPALRSVIVTHGITHYLPILDPEIRLASHQRNSFAAAVLAPDFRFVAFASDKHLYPVALAALGLNTPRLFDKEMAQFPCIAKLPGSFGSRGVQRIESKQALAQVQPNSIFQEWIEGPEYTVDCCPLQDTSSPFCSVRQRIEVRAGVCTKALIAPNPALEQVAQQLVASFGLEQPFCFQAILGGQKYWITDINPRLGAGTAMSAANGANFFAAHLTQVFGGDTRSTLLRHLERCVVTRQYVEYMSEVPCA